MNDVPDESISLSLRLVKVNDLARRGRFKEAQALLAPDGLPPKNPLELHTLAALVTQEGNHVRALALWKSLLQLDPKNADARPMIAAIETWMTRPDWFRFIPVGAVMALVIVVAAVWWAAARPSTPSLKPTPAAAPVVISPPPAAPAARPSPAAPAPANDAPPVKFQLPPPSASKPKRN